LECSIDVWGKPGKVAPIGAPKPPPRPRIDEDAVRRAARKLGAAKRPLICVGGGAQDASAEVTALSEMLQAPVYCGFRRGQGVLDSRNPFAVTNPLAHELWAKADVVIGIGTRMFFPLVNWGTDRDLTIIRVDADTDE